MVATPTKVRLPLLGQLGRLVLFLLSLLWGAAGAFIIYIGIAIDTIIGDANQFSDGDYRHSLKAVEGFARGIFFGFGGVILVIALLGLFSSLLLGRLRGGARFTAIFVATLGLLFGLAIVGGSGSHTANGVEYNYTPLIPIAQIVLNAFIIYAVGIHGPTRAAYRAKRMMNMPAGAPMMYGTPPPAGMLPQGSGNYAPQQTGYAQPQAQPQPGFAAPPSGDPAPPPPPPPPSL